METLLKIPVTIGFANLIGDDVRALVDADRTAFEPLFENVVELPVGRIPNKPWAPILFLYAQLGPDGNCMGTKVGVRQIAEATGAKLLVLAAENSRESIVNSGATAGPKLANIVFTTNRNGAGFTRFFRELFELMAGGKEFLESYVLIAPQGGATPLWLPGTIMIAEGGRQTFPKPVTKDTLLATMLDMSPGDRSVFEAYLQHPELEGANFTTVATSTNFRVYSQMVRLGWMVQGQDTAAMPDPKIEPIKNFSLTDAGRAALAGLLEDFKRYQLEHGEKMKKIFDTLCLSFVRSLHSEVAANGGRGYDKEALVVFTLAQLISTIYRPEVQLSAVERIAEQVKLRLSPKTAASN